MRGSLLRLLILLWPLPERDDAPGRSWEPVASGPYLLTSPCCPGDGVPCD